VLLVTLPLLKETFKTLFVFEFTASLKVFETVQMLTGGGPNHYSETMVSYMYNMTFTSRLFAYGMSISVFEFLIALAVTVIFMRLTKSEVAE
jgi:raffinose/stachyose/melibiose transport system permease protein